MVLLSVTLIASIAIMKNYEKTRNLRWTKGSKLSVGSPFVKNVVYNRFNKSELIRKNLISFDV